MTAMELARAERADLVAFLETLAPEQWQAPSLCQGWCVRDVVAHVVSYEGLGPRALAERVARGRFALDRVNAVALARRASATPQELLELLRAYETPRGLTAAFGGRVALADGLIHHQDIRRPLGRPREVPAERLRTVLPFAVLAPPVRGAWHVRGVRVIATDVDWSWGRGPEARGAGEAVLMAVAGRRGAARELTGPGADILVRRLDGQP